VHGWHLGGCALRHWGRRAGERALRTLPERGAEARAPRAQANAKKKEIAARLGRPVLETNQYEDVRLQAETLRASLARLTRASLVAADHRVRRHQPGPHPRHVRHHRRAGGHQARAGARCEATPSCAAPSASRVAPVARRAQHDLVILPLVRPELFERGKLLKPTKARRALA
jgi:hypothetical protein